jgi:glycosyltransferase involved in cell wall biosynthesis
MPDKIVQIVTQMEAGGAQRVALLLHQELRSRGVDAELWFLYARTAMWADEPGVRSLWTHRPRPYQLPLLLAKLTAQLSYAKPNAVIAHTHYANLLALPIARLCGISGRIAVHHNAVNTYPRMARMLEPIWNKLGMYSASVAVSQDVRRSLLQIDAAGYQSSNRCVYNGLGPKDVASESDAVSNLPAQLRSFAQGKDILFNVGRLAEQKNQLAIIEALPLLPECVAVIAGRGPLEPLLRSRAKQLGVTSRLSLLGEIPSAAVATCMAASDVFVFPSNFEAMPMALLEAMRIGLPIVASDIAAHREVAGDVAILTSTTPDDLADSIRLALIQRSNGNPLGEAARVHSLRFTVASMADGYMAAL